ncbi:putative F-box/kelch-repeat protein At3g17570 [Malania oleifera]|uniref:putative F-box/kelch-repeat protein At3g17570 n=1 Tax=Malania oleifera TaxID=397392 RepID=UPI0025ADB0FF|nr:putative F-box/kelch-repeat protein At3g17570 [Malania oleifera]
MSVCAREKKIVSSFTVSAEGAVMEASPFCSLPKEINHEILCRLDVKSLATLKLVSKYWNCFLSDPSFLRFFSQRRPCITGFFYRSSAMYDEKIRYASIDDKEEPVSDPSSPLGFLDYPAVLHNSCNGLLHWFSAWNIQFISNPLTHKSVFLPWPFAWDEFFACGIAFDPTQSDHFHVVVITIQSGFPPLKLSSRAFSSETFRWSENATSLAIRGQIGTPFRREAGIFLNGSIHWELKSTAILVYDVKEKAGRIVESPLTNSPLMEVFGGVRGFSEPACLGEFFGELHYSRVLGTALRVWVKTQILSSNSGIWVQRLLIDLSPVILRDPNIRIGESEALAFLPDCRGVLLGATGKIYAYRFDEGEVRDVCIVERNGGDCVLPRMFFPFVHSLGLFNRSPMGNTEISGSERSNWGRIRLCWNLRRLLGRSRHRIHNMEP